MKSQLLILAAFLGVVLGLLGGSTIVVAREGQTRLEEMRTADPTEVQVEDSLPVGDGSPATVPAPASEPVSQDSAPPELDPAVDAGPTNVNSVALQNGAEEQPEPDSAEKAALPQPSVLRMGQMAKMFAGMQPREAARVLSQMEDAEIEALLSLLRERQASAILGNLPPERAAVITQNVIRSDRSLQ